MGTPAGPILDGSAILPGHVFPVGKYKIRNNETGTQEEIEEKFINSRQEPAGVSPSTGGVSRPSARKTERNSNKPGHQTDEREKSKHIRTQPSLWEHHHRGPQPVFSGTGQPGDPPIFFLFLLRTSIERGGSPAVPSLPVVLKRRTPAPKKAKRRRKTVISYERMIGRFFRSRFASE
jgi:hypothetical protein